MRDEIEVSRDEIQRGACKVQRVERGESVEMLSESSDECGESDVVEMSRERNEIEYWNESDEKRGEIMPPCLKFRELSTRIIPIYVYMNFNFFLIINFSKYIYIYIYIYMYI